MPKSRKKSKNSNSATKLIALLLLILGISLILGLVFVSLNQKESLSYYFTKETNNSSEKIYNNLLNLTEENYPDTPEKVVEIYTDSYKLLYGGRIKEEYLNELIPIILEKQRILFSNELVNSNPVEQQIQFVKENVEFFQKEKLKIVSININPPIYDQNDNNLVYFNITMQDNSKPTETHSQNYYFKYHLKKDSNNKWHIIGFYPTDSEFNKL